MVTQVMNLLDTLEFPHGPRDYSESALQFEDPTIVEKPELNLSRWTAHNKLKIFVVLFSHDDAGKPIKNAIAIDFQL